MGDIIRFNKARLLEQADRIDTVVDALYRTRLSYEDMRSFLENAEGKVVRAASAEANQMIYKINLHSDRMESIKEDIERYLFQTSEYIAPINEDEDLVIDPESVKIAISMVIREIENVIETDMFDTVEGDCIYEDEYATPELEQNYVDLMECIDYHFDVTCVKLEEVVERLNRLYDRVENLLYIDKLFELTEDLADDSFYDNKEYNVNMADITTAEIESLDVEEQMITLGMTEEMNQYVNASISYERANEDYKNAVTYASSTTTYHSSVVNDASDAMNKAYKTYEDASSTRKTTIDSAAKEIYETRSIADGMDKEYQTAHNNYISASTSSVIQEEKDTLKVSNAYNTRVEKKSAYDNASKSSSIASEDYKSASFSYKYASITSKSYTTGQEAIIGNIKNKVSYCELVWNVKYSQYKAAKDAYDNSLKTNASNSSICRKLKEDYVKAQAAENEALTAKNNAQKELDDAYASFNKNKQQYEEKMNAAYVEQLKREKELQAANDKTSNAKKEYDNASIAHDDSVNEMKVNKEYQQQLFNYYAERSGITYDNASKASAHASTTYEVQSSIVADATTWENKCSTTYSTKVSNYESASTSSTASKEKSDYLVSSYSNELVIHVDNLTKTTEKSKSSVQNKTTKTDKVKEARKKLVDYAKTNYSDDWLSMEIFDLLVKAIDTLHDTIPESIDVIKYDMLLKFMKKSTLSDWLHNVLDIIGFFPVVGDICDLVNSILYLFEKRWGMAALSAIAVIPLIGSAATAGKLGKSAQSIAIKIGSKFKFRAVELVLEHGEKFVSKLAKYGDDLMELIVKYSDEFLEKVFKYGDEVIDFAKKVGKYGDNFMSMLKTYGDEIIEKFIKTKDKDDFVKFICNKIDNVTGLRNCFVAGTLVRTIDGPKNIEDIVEGDYVLAYNTETGEQGYKPVVTTFTSIKERIVRIEVNGTVIETTEGHPFWIDGHGFKVAGEIQQGEFVLTANGETREVSAIETVTEHVQVFNFEVADWHTYYVSQEDVLVHNFCGTTFATYEQLKNHLKGEITEYIAKNKPKYARDVKKWLAEEGHYITILDAKVAAKEGIENVTENVWTYTHRYKVGDKIIEESVPYVDGLVRFPDEFLHPNDALKRIDIGEFTGYRDKDRKKVEKLIKEKFPDIEIPSSEEYELHHDTVNGVFQYVKKEIHKKFTHIGGQSIFS